MKFFRRFAQTALITLAGLLAACGGSDDPPAPTEGSATLGAAGGTVDGPDGVRLEVPTDSLASNVTFRIARNASGAPALEGLDALSPVYEVTPHGQAFGATALFSIPLSAAQIPAGATPVLLKAEPGGKWRVMPNGSADPARLAADVGELSYFVIGTCSASNTAWTIGFAGCPTNHELTLTMFDGQNQPINILRGPNGVQLPLWYATDTVQTRVFTLNWTRPAGTNRTDTVGVAGLPGGVTTNLNPREQDVNGNVSRTFIVTIDPSQVTGASGTNGTMVRVRAYAVYNTVAFQLGVGNVPVGFSFDTEIPILVRFNGAQPVITQQPANVGVTDGQPASFTVQANITPSSALTYQWSRRATAGGTFAPIAGATAATYNLATTALTDDGAQFQVAVCAAPTRCATSSPATLSVTQAPVAPGFSTQPSSIAVAAGQTASFSVTATGNPLPRIDWQSAPASDPNNFTSLSVAPGCVRTDPPSSGTTTAATCTVGPLAVGESGRRYRATATNSVTATNSTVATITVNPVPLAPTIAQQPAAQSTTVGGSATFTVTATGTAPLNYTWQQSGTNLPSVSGGFNAGTCSGTVTYSNGNATITLSGLSAGCNGVLVGVTVSNGINPNAVSNSVMLTVNAVTQGLSLLAGDIGGPGSLDGTGADARVVLNPDNGIAFDAAGNAYFSETISGRVRRVTPAGVVTTIAGASTPLRNPGGVVVDSAGNVFVVERSGDRIVRITSSGVLSTWVQIFNLQSYLAIDAGDNLYISAKVNGVSAVSKISPTQGITSFYDFGNVDDDIGARQVGSDGSVYGVGRGALYGTVVRITPAGALSVLAGASGQEGNVDGVGAAARFFGINGLAFGAGGDLFATDSNNRSVRRITLAGAVTTVSGANAAPFEPRDGAGTAARYDYLGSIAAGPGGDLLIGDVATLRKLTPSPNYFASTLAGKRLQVGATDGVGALARFNCFCDVALDAAGNAYLASPGGIRSVTPGGTVTTLPGTSSFYYYIAFDASRGEFVAASPFAVWRVTPAGVATLLAGDPASQAYVDGTGSAANFFQISGLAVDAAGNVFVSEGLSYTIRRITPAGVVTTFAGAPDQPGTADGPAADARFSGASGLAVDGSGNLFVASGQTIRRITSAGQVSTVAGTPNALGSVDGVGAAARFRSPRKLAFEPSGNLLISDGSTLRRMTPANAVTTVMGVDGESAVRFGASPRLNSIGGLAVRPNGRVVLTSEAAVLEAQLP